MGPVTSETARQSASFSSSSTRFWKFGVIVESMILHLVTRAEEGHGHRENAERGRRLLTGERRKKEDHPFGTHRYPFTHFHKPLDTEL